MKNNWLYGALILMMGLSASCKKDNANPDAVIEHTLTVSSIISNNGDIDANRKGFIDLYDGLLFSQTEGATNSSKIDFAYNYHGGGTGKGRTFENVKSMSNRTSYVNAFGTITNSKITNLASRMVNVTDFNNIKSGADISALFTDKQVDNMNVYEGISDNNTDISIGNVFSFTDKNGKKGLILVDDYQRSPAIGSEAPITIHIKIQR